MKVGLTDYKATTTRPDSTGRRLALAVVCDAVGASEFGADEGFPALVGEVGVIVETGDDMASEFRGFGLVKDVTEFGGVAGDDVAYPLGE